MFEIKVRENESFETNKNCIVLVHEKWNDYWRYETLYRFFYYDENGAKYDFGEVKIASVNNLNKIPTVITEKLSDEFISLGQSEIYYKNILSKINDLPCNPLYILNDIAKNLDLFDKYRKLDVVTDSLMRGISSNVVTSQFHRIANGGAVLTPYNFAYVFHEDSKDSTSDENRLTFDVKINSLPPTNIHVLIGRNGVGKTRIFNHMVSEFLNKTAKDGYFESNNEILYDPHKLFPNLIYMSYSAFDNMTYVENQNSDGDVKYTYLGLRKKIDDGTDENTKFVTKSLDDLSEEFCESINNCKVSILKKQHLLEALEKLESDPVFKNAEITNLIKKYNMTSKDDNDKVDINLKNIFKRLSTGHMIILLTITKLVETLEEKSLVLLDEPETHLHPPLLASFIRCLSSLVIKRNAVAMIATHSPVILQEIPKSCAWILRRSGSICNISRPRLETFGESYSNLVEDVFGLELEQSGFHQLLKDQVRKISTYERLREKFEHQLGSDADIIARTLYIQKENKKGNSNEN